MILSLVEPDACAHRTRQTTLGSEQPAGLEGLLDQFPHLGHFLLGGRSALRLGGFVQTQVSHSHVSSILVGSWLTARPRPNMRPGSIGTATEMKPDRQWPEFFFTTRPD